MLLHLSCKEEISVRFTLEAPTKPQNKMIYTATFIFNEFGTNLLLIRKNKPEWQKGFLNAIGGKLEDDDFNTTTCAIREVKEETGISLNEDEIEQFHIMSHDGNYIYFFKSFTDKVYDYTQMEEEEFVLVDNVDEYIPENVIPNLNWLIPMALDNNINFSASNYK